MAKIIYLLLFAIFTLSYNNLLSQHDTIPLHDNFSIYSEYVNETRVINVWTPPNYKQSTEKFPVLYMPDGGIKEDFPHIANTIAKLVESKKIPPIILVGIENTERGRDLTGFSKVKSNEKYCPLTDGAKNFRDFIVKELTPKIDKEYRTMPKKGIIGESLAGLFVMETFLTNPEAFDFYIAMDPSLWWNKHYLIKSAETFLEKFPDKDTKLWFAGSDAKDISPYTKTLAKKLENNAPNKLVWKYSDEPNEHHNTIFRATKEKALIWIFKNIQ